MGKMKQLIPGVTVKRSKESLILTGVPKTFMNYHLEASFKILEKEETKDGKTIIKEAELIEISLVPDKEGIKKK